MPKPKKSSNRSRTSKKSSSNAVISRDLDAIMSKRSWFMSLVIVFAIVVMGYVGWFVWKNHHYGAVKAHAATWELVGDTTVDGVQYRAAACQTSVDSKAYGPLWRVNVFLTKSSASAQAFGIATAYAGRGFVSSPDYSSGIQTTVGGGGQWAWWDHTMQEYSFYVSKINSPNAYLNAGFYTNDMRTYSLTNVFKTQASLDSPTSPLISNLQSC